MNIFTLCNKSLSCYDVFENDASLCSKQNVVNANSNSTFVLYLHRKQILASGY